MFSQSFSGIPQPSSEMRTLILAAPLSLAREISTVIRPAAPPASAALRRMFKKTCLILSPSTTTAGRSEAKRFSRMIFFSWKESLISFRDSSTIWTTENRSGLSSETRVKLSISLMNFSIWPMPSWEMLRCSFSSSSKRSLWVSFWMLSLTEVRGLRISWAMEANGPLHELLQRSGDPLGQDDCPYQPQKKSAAADEDEHQPGPTDLLLVFLEGKPHLDRTPVIRRPLGEGRHLDLDDRDRLAVQPEVPPADGRHLLAHLFRQAAAALDILFVPDDIAEHIGVAELVIDDDIDLAAVDFPLNVALDPGRIPKGEAFQVQAGYVPGRQNPPVLRFLENRPHLSPFNQEEDGADKKDQDEGDGDHEAGVERDLETRPEYSHFSSQILLGWRWKNPRGGGR